MDRSTRTHHRAQVGHVILRELTGREYEDPAAELRNQLPKLRSALLALTKVVELPPSLKLVLSLSASAIATLPGDDIQCEVAPILTRLQIDLELCVSRVGLAPVAAALSLLLDCRWICLLPPCLGHASFQVEPVETGEVASREEIEARVRHHARAALLARVVDGPPWLPDRPYPTLGDQ